MRSKYAKLATVCSLLLVLVLLVGCAASDKEEATPTEQVAGVVGASAGASVLDEIRERGVIRMAIFATGDSPLQRTNAETSEIEGYFADLGNMLAKDLGVEPEWHNVEWKAIIPSLLSGKVDIIMAGPSATPERALSIDFAGTTIFYNTCAIVHKDGPIKTLEDIKKPGVRIAVLMGTTHHMLAMNEYPDAEIKITEAGGAGGSLDIATGKADVSFGNVYGIFRTQEEYPMLVPVRDENGDIAVMGRESGDLAIRQGDPRFYNWCQNWVKWYREQGILDALYYHWMGHMFEPGYGVTE